MRIYILLIAYLLVSCSEKTESPASESEPGEVNGIPAGAVIEEYADNPGLVKVTINDSQGKVSANGVYLNQKREGSWVDYTPTGLVKSITSYVSGKKEGALVEFNDNGQLLRRSYYHNDLRDGEYKEYNYYSVQCRIASTICSKSLFKRQFMGFL